jgi:hypothetical protein
MRIIPAVKGVGFVSGRMSYLVLRGHWCDIIVLNVHAPTEDKIDDVKDRFYDCADCLQDNSSARTPRKTRSYFVKDACLQLRCLEIDVLFFRAFAWCGPHRKHNFPLYCCHVLNLGLTGRRIDLSSSVVACIPAAPWPWGRVSL